MFNEGQNEQTPRVRCDHMYRRSQVVQWVHLCPQGGEKLFRHNLLGNVHPQAEQEPIFSTFFCGRVRFGGGSGSFSSFRPSFEGRRLRKVINFGGGKLHPRQNPGYVYDHMTGGIVTSKHTKCSAVNLNLFQPLHLHHVLVITDTSTSRPTYKLI